MRKSKITDPRNVPLKESPRKLSKFAKGNANVRAAGTTNKPNKGFGSHPKRPAKYLTSGKKFKQGGSFKGDNTAANNGETGTSMQSAYRRAS